MQEHILHAAKDVIERGAKPEHVAAAMFGQATYFLKETGYDEDQIIDMARSALKNSITIKMVAITKYREIKLQFIVSSTFLQLLFINYAHRINRDPF